MLFGPLVSRLRPEGSEIVFPHHVPRLVRDGGGASQVVGVVEILFPLRSVPGGLAFHLGEEIVEDVDELLVVA